MLYCRADIVLIEMNVCNLIFKYLQDYQNNAPALILVISLASLQWIVLFRVAKQVTLNSWQFLVFQLTSEDYFTRSITKPTEPSQSK